MERFHQSQRVFHNPSAVHADLCDDSRIDVGFTAYQACGVAADSPVPPVCGARRGRRPHVGLHLRRQIRADWSVLPRHRITSAGPVLRETHPVRHREHHHLGVCGLQHAHHLLIIEGASRRTV